MGRRNRLIMSGLTIVALVLAQVGCGTHTPRPVNTDSLEEIKPLVPIQNQKRIDPPAPAPISEKLEPVTKGLDMDTKIYSLVLTDAPLSEVIKALTMDSNINLSIDSEINLNKAVTVHLKQVTMAEALEMVVKKGAGYAWKLEGENLHIQRFEERIYHLDYLDLSGETDVEVGGDMLASSVESSGVTGKYKVKTKRTKENSDIWIGVADTLKGIKSEDGVLQINRNSGIIYIADTPKRVASMVMFLDSLAGALHRQVFIEAKILEVYLSEEYQYGIDWTKLDIAFSSDSGIFPDQFGLDFNTGGTILLANQTRFFAILDFLRTQGDISVVSNPHLTVMNGQSAIMTVGFQFPYADIDGVDRDALTGITTYGSSIKRAILGLQLGITAHITEDGIVTLNIVPTITRIQGEEIIEIPTSGTDNSSISNPIIDLQELSTTVRVREGNSIVLAGLINQIREVTEQGLPILGSIPGLKYLFTHVEETNKNRELVIMITPYMRNVM